MGHPVHGAHHDLYGYARFEHRQRGPPRDAEGPGSRPWSDPMGLIGLPAYHVRVPARVRAPGRPARQGSFLRVRRGDLHHRFTHVRPFHHAARTCGVPCGARHRRGIGHGEQHGHHHRGVSRSRARSRVGAVGELCRARHDVRARARRFHRGGDALGVYLPHQRSRGCALACAGPIYSAAHRVHSRGWDHGRLWRGSTRPRHVAHIPVRHHAAEQPRAACCRFVCGGRYTARSVRPSRACGRTAFGGVWHLLR